MNTLTETKSAFETCPACARVWLPSNETVATLAYWRQFPGEDLLWHQHCPDCAPGERARIERRWHRADPKLMRREEAKRWRGLWAKGNRRVRCPECGKVHWRGPGKHAGPCEHCDAARADLARRTRTCDWCGSGFVLPVGTPRTGETRDFCSADCRADERGARWTEEHSPHGGNQTTLDRLPNIAAAVAALNWASQRGPDTDRACAFLFGPSGSGKTRALILMGAALCRDDSWPLYLDGAGFQREIVTRCRPGSEESPEAWMDTILAAQTVILDEVEKLSLRGADGQATRTCRELFQLVRVRSDAGRQTIFASNLAPDDFADQVADIAYRDPIRRRLREQFAHFDFTPAPPAPPAPTPAPPAPPAPRRYNRLDNFKKRKPTPTT